MRIDRSRTQKAKTQKPVAATAEPKKTKAVVTQQAAAAKAAKANAARQAANRPPPAAAENAAKPQVAKGITVNMTGTWNRGQRNQGKSGTMTVNGKTYPVTSGGSARGNLPAGAYSVKKHLQNRSQPKSMTVGKTGYSFAVSDKKDARVGGAPRKALRIHPDGGSKGTAGCVGVVGSEATQKEVRRELNKAIDKNGGAVKMVVKDSDKAAA